MTVTSEEPRVDELLELYERMALIRATETAAFDLFMAGLVKGTTHLANGQEAVAVGASAALEPDDYVFATYRGHHHAIARGASPEGCLAELMSRATGLCGAKGGSMHLTVADHNMLGSYAIVGAHLPIACGAAWSAKLRGTGQVAVAFFGDGATNIGAFHEALNLAAVWRLPVLFVCENNLYMEYTSIKTVTAVAQPAAGRAPAYQLPAEVIDGNDVVAVQPRRGGRRRPGPGRGRPNGDRGPHLPPPRPLAHRPGQVPAQGGGRGLAQARPAAGPGRAAARPRGRPAGHRRARHPGPRPGGGGRRGGQGGPAAGGSERLHRRVGGRRCAVADLMTYREAVAAGIAQEMRRDETVVCLGEDIGAAEGVFKTAAGLFAEFGPERVWDTPISEQAIVGAAMGAAMTGLRPVAEIMFSDFLACCWDYVANEIPKMRYMTGGQVTVPLVVRTANGGGLGFGAQHSQAVENWAFAVPGLKIAAPSTPADMVGLMAAAIRSDDPVLVFEHKSLFATKGDPPPAGDHVLPLGAAEVRRPGTDVTLVALASTVPTAMAAAEELAGDGVEAEVIDLRCLVPLDARTVLESVARTSRLVVVEENPYQGGWGGTVASIVAEEGFYDLDAPIRRVAGACVPLPFAANLEQAVTPTAAKVAAAVREAMDAG